MFIVCLHVFIDSFIFPLFAGRHAVNTKKSCYQGPENKARCGSGPSSPPAPHSQKLIFRSTGCSRSNSSPCRVQVRTRTRTRQDMRIRIRSMYTTALAAGIIIACSRVPGSLPNMNVIRAQSLCQHLSSMYTTASSLPVHNTSLHG